MDAALWRCLWVWERHGSHTAMEEGEPVVANTLGEPFGVWEKERAECRRMWERKNPQKGRAAVSKLVFMFYGEVSC